MADLKRINLRVSADLFERIKDKAWERRTTYQAAGVELFEAWISSSGKSTTPIRGIASPAQEAHNALSGLQAELERVPAEMQSVLIAVLERAVGIFADLGQGKLIEEGHRDKEGERRELEIEARSVRGTLDKITGKPAESTDPVPERKKRSK